MNPFIILFNIEQFHGLVPEVEDKHHVKGCDKYYEEDEDPS